MASTESGVRGSERRVQHGLRALRDDLIPGVLSFPQPGTTSSDRIPLGHPVLRDVDTVWIGHEHGSSIVAFFHPVDKRRPIPVLQVGPTDIIEETCTLRTVLPPIADTLLEQAKLGRLPDSTVGMVIPNLEAVHNVFVIYSRALQDEIDRRNLRTLPR